MSTQNHHEAIREIFLRRRSEYTTPEAAQLLRTTRENFLAWIAAGVLDVQARGRRRQLGGERHAVVRWNELASAAMLRWTVMEIHDALGEDAARVLPRLLRPVELQSVRLPEYQMQLLEVLARKERITVEGYLYTALLGLETAASHAEIERTLPGFTEAIQFPNV